MDGYTVGIEWDTDEPVWPSQNSSRRASLAGSNQGKRKLPSRRIDRVFEPREINGDPAVLKKMVQDYLSAEYDSDPNWSQPLTQAPATGALVTGSFGEWRGHIRREPNDNVHVGLDLKANTGDEVVASRGGVLIVHNGYADGRYVVISHLDGTYSRYLHLLPWTTNDAKAEFVQRGTRLGQVGSPVGGPHLHFEIRKDANFFSDIRGARCWSGSNPGTGNVYREWTRKQSGARSIPDSGRTSSTFLCRIP